ncbi:HNH endonuclease [Paradesulfitobacterium ferrireducens]|uniref:HNH endonuclease n=1 Tax=Paradesulfitobacterium ferrireducens TaxID=2816476 RepID=UPI001A8FC621|nr:HNH endonuclease [Paradesulfitobacterium ferrireducens]
MAQARNPKWDRDELILALDLYFRHNPLNINSSHVEVVKLSQVLNSLPIHSNKPDAERFRNPNGVYMKLCNFMRFDPSYHGTGLERGGKLEEQIWNEFANDPDNLRLIAQSIIEGSHQTDVEAMYHDDEDETAFPEGRVLYRQHRSRERNKTLVARAKEKALESGSLRCQICGFDFYEKYGDLGKGFIECHHTIPVSEYTRTIGTKLSDLVLVCSNCHRMLHRRRPWLSIDQLKRLVR